MAMERAGAEPRGAKDVVVGVIGGAVCTMTRTFRELLLRLRKVGVRKT
jgi:hypothetical protein